MTLHRYITNIGTAGAAAAQALGAGVAETVIQLASPASRKFQVVELGISFNSVTAADVPATVELLVQTTAGTATAVTPVPEDDDMPPALVTAQHAFTAEPTAGLIKWSTFVPVVGGLFIYQMPLDREIICDISTRLGMRVTSPSALSCRGYLVHEE